MNATLSVRNPVTVYRATNKFAAGKAAGTRSEAEWLTWLVRSGIALNAREAKEIFNMRMNTGWFERNNKIAA